MTSLSRHHFLTFFPHFFTHFLTSLSRHPFFDSFFPQFLTPIPFFTYDVIITSSFLSDFFLMFFLSGDHYWPLVYQRIFSIIVGLHFSQSFCLVGFLFSPPFFPPFLPRHFSLMMSLFFWQFFGPVFNHFLIVFVPFLSVFWRRSLFYFFQQFSSGVIQLLAFLKVLFFTRSYITPCFFFSIFFFFSVFGSFFHVFYS